MSAGIGIAPSWHTERLGHLAQVKGGKRLPKGEKLLTEPTPFPYIRVCDFNAFSVDLSDIQYLTPEIQEKISRYIITKEDVFISIAGTIGRVGTIPESLDGANLTENAARVVLERDGSLDKEFLKYCLASPEIQQDIASRRSKNAQPKLALAQIKDLEISLPPLPEQKKIAHILSTVQRAIEAQERIIQTTTELKKALMHKLFTEGLRNEPQKQTEIGPVPESWEVVELEAKAESFQYGTSVKCGYDVDGKPVLRIPNVVGGHVAPADLKFGKPKKNELGKLALERGDLLFVRTNGAKKNAGRCSKFNDELADCYFASYLIRVRLDPTVLNPDFLNEYSRTEVGTSFLSGKAIRTADGKFNINSGTLKTMLVPVPAIEEQEEIARTLAFLDDKATNAISKKMGLQDLFRTLLHELMTAKTRVNQVDQALYVKGEQNA
ncbi:MAG: restriction endonuclease subunit S [Sedimenticola sp.]